jgi:hypothetical protein
MFCADIAIRAVLGSEEGTMGCKIAAGRQTAAERQKSSAFAKRGAAKVIRRTLVVVACLLMASVGRGQEKALPRIAGMRTEGDAVQTFGCRFGPGVIGNAGKINAALADRANIYPLSIPAGYLEITEPILWPTRTGYSLLGVGYSRDLNDGMYTGALVGGQASRIVWRGIGKSATTDPMLLYSGYGGTIERIHFQGRPVPPGGKPNSEPPASAAGPKALVGIKVNTSTNVGSVLNSGKIAIRDCSFYQLQTGILFGPHMDNLDQETYSGDTDNHADESSLANLHFYYPYDDNPTQETRSCIRFRNNQSVGFDMAGIRVNGNPNEIFYFERGGRLVCTSAVLSGATSATNPTTVLRIGKTYASSAAFRVECDIDGYSGKDGDGVGGYFKLIQMDRSRAGETYVEYSGVIGPISYATPIVVARGACKIVLRGVYGLNANSLQLIGKVLGGGEKRVCNVRLEDCTIRGCKWPSELVTAADDRTAPSSGPWRLTWSGCSRIALGANSEGFGIPFEDSTAATAVESKDISPGTIAEP